MIAAIYEKITARVGELVLCLAGDRASVAPDTFALVYHEGVFCHELFLLFCSKAALALLLVYRRSKALSRCCRRIPAELFAFRFHVGEKELPGCRQQYANGNIQTCLRNYGMYLTHVSTTALVMR